MTYIPRVVNQLDGSRCQGDNCGPATGAALLDYVTGGRNRTTGAAVRNRISLTHCGGTLIQTVDAALDRGWPSAAVINEVDVVGWTKVATVLTEGRGVYLGIGYSAVYKYLPSLAGSLTFTGNHFWSVVGDWMCADPLWDGRSFWNGKRAPTPVFRPVSPATLSRLAGAFKVNGVPLGTGRAYVGFTRKPTPAPIPVVPEDVDMTITDWVGQRWTPKTTRRPFRKDPIRGSGGKILGYIEFGQTVVTGIEATTKDGNVWRLAERNVGGDLKPVWLLRADFDPLTDRGDPLDLELHTYLRDQ